MPENVLCPGMRGLWWRLSTRLSYANVVATLALFVALGGVSYAAVVLPAHSVGARQLKAGAVGPAQLAFPLASASRYSRTPVRLLKNACDEPLLPGEPAPPCTPSVDTGNETTRLHVTATRSGHLLVLATVSLGDTTPPGTDATVTVGVFLDQTQVSERTLKLPGDTRPTLPVQIYLPLTKGEHEIGIEPTGAEYSTREPGEIIATPIVVAALVLP